MKNLLSNIQAWQKAFIEQYNMLVLREKTGKALAIAFSQEGFVWTTDIYGRYIFVEGEMPLIGKDIKSIMNLPYAQNKLKEFVVEKFVPRDHYNAKGSLKKKEQLAEYHFCNKALAILSLQNLVNSD